MAHEISSDILDTALGRVVHAVGDGNRPILNTVLFEGDEHGFRLVAADNYRIAIADLSPKDHSDFGRIPVAADYIATLRAFLKIRKRAVALEHQDKHLVVRDSYGAVELRIVDGVYPDYAKVIAFDGPALAVNPAFLVDVARATKTRGAVLKIRKGAEVTAPFVFEVPGYREAVLGVRISEPEATP